MNELYEVIISNPITSITLTISIIGLFFGIKRYLIAKKKSKIDLIEHKDRYRPFGLYLVDFYRIIKKERKFLIFHIRLTNHANSKNTYCADLELEYFTENKNIIRISHNKELFKEIEHKDLTQLDTHIRLNEKEIASGWLIFDLPKHLHKTRIKKYSIYITDIEQNSLKMESYIAKDMVYEDKEV